MKIALYTGSLDPITNGHLEILGQSSEIFDEVFIAIAKNAKKDEFIPLADRLNLVKQAVKGYDNVKVITYEGLTAKYALENDIEYFIRGLRNSKDLDYELQMADLNRLLNKNLTTVFFTTTAESRCISSSAVREIYSNNGDISKLVPDCVVKYLQKFNR